jgi:Late embryogenesis abundant protein
MNSKNIGLSVLVAGIGYGIYNVFMASSKLQFGDIKLKGKPVINLTGVHIYLNLPITNPDKKTSLPFDGFVGALWYGTHKLAAINIADKISIKANSTVNLTVKIDVAFLGLGAQIVEIISGGDYLNALFVKGVISSGSLKSTVSQKVF